MKMEHKPTADFAPLSLQMRIAQLEAENEQLKAENEQLKAENEQLKTKNEELKSENEVFREVAEDIPSKPKYRKTPINEPLITPEVDTGKPKPWLANNRVSAVHEGVRCGPALMFKAADMANRPVLGDRKAFKASEFGGANSKWKSMQADNRLKAGWVDFVRVSDKLGLNYPQRCNLLGLTSQNDPQLRVFMGLKKLDQTKSHQPVPPRYDELLSSTAEILLERLPQISQLAQAMAQLDNTPGFYRHWPTWAVEPCATVAEFDKYAAVFRRDATIAEYASFIHPAHLSKKLGYHVSPNTILAPDDTTGVVPDPMELLTDRGAGLSKLTTWLQQECCERQAVLSPEQVQKGKSIAASVRDDVRDFTRRIKGFTKKLNL
jgi:FtsZ-binding cell division protein ZapB